MEAKVRNRKQTGNKEINEKENEKKRLSISEENEDEKKHMKTKESKWKKYVHFVIISIYTYIKSKIKSKHKYSFCMGLFIVFLICSGFFQLLAEMYYTYIYKFNFIESSNTEKLKEVFFSNKPYLVYCKNGKHESIHPVINSSKMQFPDILNVAIMDCKTLLPSKQNIYERFSLPDNTPAFVISFGKKPKPISLNILNNKKNFLNFIHDAIVFHVPFFNKFPQFQTKCLNENKKCVLFISKHNLMYNNRRYNLINDIFIINKYFSINPMIIDNKKYQLKLSDEIFTSYDKKNKDMHVLCLFNEPENNEDGYYGFFYNDNIDDLKKLGNFVNTCIKSNKNDSHVTKLSTKPKIKYRTSKQTK